MDIQDHERWDAGIEFLTNLEGKRAHIIHDYDVDGISGGLLLRHALRRLGAEATASTRQGRGAGLMHEELARIKETHNPEALIITDQDPKSFGHYDGLRTIFPDLPIMVVDHHFVQDYDDVTFIHPEPIYGVSGSDYPSARLVYDLASAVAPVEDLAWLACSGILGDMGGKRMRDFLERTAERENVELPEDPYESAFANIGEAIECCSTASEEELQGYINRLKDEETLQGALAIGNPCQYVRDEVDFYLNEGFDLADNHGPIWFIPIESQYGIAGWVATLLSVEYPERIIICYRDQVDGTSLSSRHQARTVHLGELMKQVTESLGGGGGGHAPAAGGRIPPGQLETFKERFLKAVNDSLEAS